MPKSRGKKTISSPPSTAPLGHLQKEQLQRLSVRDSVRLALAATNDLDIDEDAIESLVEHAKVRGGMIRGLEEG